MSLRQLVFNLWLEGSSTVEHNGVAYAGTITIESGMVEVRSKHFPACPDCDLSSDFVRDCKKCDRSKGNNVRFLAGRGDGVYAGLRIESSEGLAAAIYVFDEDNTLANAFSDQLNGETLKGTDFQTLFTNSVLSGFSELDAFFAGSVDAKWEGSVSNLGFVVGDATSSAQATATVDHPLANGKYSVYLFMEPILASPVVQLALKMGADEKTFTAGYADAMRPRVALIVNSARRSEFLQEIPIMDVDWKSQSAVWSQTTVAGNAGGNNAGPANYYNALFWLSAMKDQEKVAQNPEFNDYMSFIYMNRAYGYFFAGALNGDEGCIAAVEEIVMNEEEPEAFLQEELLAEILSPRGLRVTDEALSLFRTVIEGAAQTPNHDLFCTECGTRFYAGAQFCGECGSRRK